MIAQDINNGGLNGGVEDGPNSDAMKVNNNIRKRGQTEASEEKKPQLKKKKRRRKKKKVENGKIKEEGLDRSESGSTGLVNTDESIVRKNVETSLNIYVGGIPYYSTEEDIRSYFEGFGTITYIDCMTFPDSEKFRGFAIITYKTEAAAKRALALDGFDLGGFFLKIQPYKSAIVNKLPKFSPSVVDGYNRIYIGNLSRDTNEVDLWKLFADCAVTSIRIGEDNESGEIKVYAHVDFADGLSLHTALKLDQTIVYGRTLRINCLVPKKATGTWLKFWPNDHQEDSWKMGNTTKLESTPKDNEVDKSNVSVVENQVTSSGTNDVTSKRRWQICYECRERGHLSSACPKKLAANSTIPVPLEAGQMIASSEKRSGTTLIPFTKDNQDIGKKRKFTKFEATPRYYELDRSTVIVVVENQATSSWINNFSSKRRWRICYECREHGHLSSACPKNLAANSTISVPLEAGQMIVSSEKKGSGTTLIPLPKDNQEDIGEKRKLIEFEDTPRDHEIDRSTASLAVENQVTSSGTNNVSSKRRWRICYECRERGHLSSTCPKKLTANSTIPGQISVSSEKQGSGTTLIPLPKDNQEDIGEKRKFTKFEDTPKDHEIDRSTVTVSLVVENQVTSSGTNNVSSKRRLQICYECRECGHLSSTCPKKLTANSTIPGQMIVSSEKQGSGTTLIPLPKVNQEVIGEKRKLTKLEDTLRDHEIDRSIFSLVAENQVASSGANALRLKIRKRKCYKCKERGHLLSSCPKKLAADSTNPDNHDDSGKGNFTKFEATPRDNEVDQSNVSVVIENQVTSSESKALSSKIRKRICYKCRERGHLLSSCPKKQAVDSTNPVVENQVTSSGRNALCSKIRKRTCFRCMKRKCYKCRERGHISSSCPKTLDADSTNPVTAVKLLPIHSCGCMSSADVMPVDATSVQGSVRSMLVRWLRPPYPWIKLNTDGSYDRDTGVASGGGLIRDHFGNLQLAFYMPLKATSSFDAELQALLHGLHLARQFNRPIWIELDALEVVRLFETGRPGALQIHHTLTDIRTLMTQVQTWITHIFREGNRPADYMAMMGVGSNALHLVYPYSAPKYFMELVLMDQIGEPSFRVI